MNASVVPDEAQMRAMAGSDHQGPIVMVNLLKYRVRAAYEAGKAEAKQNLSGREAYQRYGMVAMQHVASCGGGIVWMGAQKFAFIGGPEQDWDEIVCVRYPSREAFLKMIANPEYIAASYHRDAGLERTALLCCTAGSAA
jgi:uncharacterized protein (DUF1330 family)